MATKEVIESECDVCHTTARSEAPFDARRKRQTFTLPPKWMHVAGRTDQGPVMSIDLCPACSMNVLKAAGMTKLGRPKVAVVRALPTPKAL